MENQHRKIKGYRELSELEIELMNAVKAKGQELLDLQADIQLMLSMQYQDKGEAAYPSEEPEAVKEFKRFRAAEPTKWVDIGKTDIQTGIMALVRAIAQPDNC